MQQSKTLNQLVEKYNFALENDLESEIFRLSRLIDERLKLEREVKNTRISIDLDYNSK